MSDAELVRNARTGAAAAQDELVRRHIDAAYRVALSLTRDPDVAADVVQDAFVKAFGSLDGFRGDASLRTWIVAITANEARGFFRRSQRRKEASLDAATEVASVQPDPAERAVTESEAARARAELEKLPEKQRLSVTLRIEEGMSFREIGSVVGSSEGAARVNYFHGIRRLRELME
jgi:RNA polymerase sigma-70 factor (ECF subfamily)